MRSVRVKPADCQASLTAAAAKQLRVGLASASIRRFSGDVHITSATNGLIKALSRVSEDLAELSFYDDA